VASGVAAFTYSLLNVNSNRPAITKTAVIEASKILIPGTSKLKVHYVVLKLETL
jgi:hypothetical protein